MSYQEQADLYRGPQRNRMDIAVREQGAIFAADGRPDIAALGQGIVGGNLQDIDAVMANVCVSPSWSEIADDDAALTGAIQSVFPTVAAARYPQATE